MSTRTIAIIFVVLLIILGLLFFGGSASAPAPVGGGVPVNTMAPAPDAPSAQTAPQGGHTMPDGSVMMNTDTSANTHMMPDGTMMSN